MEIMSVYDVEVEANYKPQAFGKAAAKRLADFGDRGVLVSWSERLHCRRKGP